MAPIDVKFDNQEIVWNNLYGTVEPPSRKVFTEGDRVRIAQTRQMFKKGYTAAWTEELFTVSRINTTTKPITYVLKDDTGAEVKGGFYKEELQKVGDKETYRVESIVRERQGHKGKEYLVKWFGYNPSFNSWISDKHLVKYKN